MFDPFGITYNNRRIQKRSQIIRPKGLNNAPDNAISNSDMQTWAEILKVNKIPAFIPPPPNFFPLILKSLSLTFALAQPNVVSCDSEFLENDFTLSEENTNIEVPPFQYLLKITKHLSEDWRLIIYYNIDEQSTYKDLYIGDWYYLGTQQLLKQVTFNVYPINDPQYIVPLIAIDQNNDDTTEFSFNSAALIPGIVRE